MLELLIHLLWTSSAVWIFCVVFSVYCIWFCVLAFGHGDREDKWTFKDYVYFSRRCVSNKSWQKSLAFRLQGEILWSRGFCPEHHRLRDKSPTSPDTGDCGGDWWVWEWKAAGDDKSVKTERWQRGGGVSITTAWTNWRQRNIFKKEQAARW